MDYIYLLHHTYSYGEEDKYDETKFIGAFSSMENADNIRKELYKKEGFNRFSFECFTIDRVLIDEIVGWSDGFVTWEEASSVQWECKVIVWKFFFSLFMTKYLDKTHVFQITHPETFNPDIVGGIPWHEIIPWLLAGLASLALILLPFGLIFLGAFGVGTVVYYNVQAVVKPYPGVPLTDNELKWITSGSIKAKIIEAAKLITLTLANYLSESNHGHKWGLVKNLIDIKKIY